VGVEPAGTDAAGVDPPDADAAGVDAGVVGAVLGFGAGTGVGSETDRAGWRGTDTDPGAALAGTDTDPGAALVGTDADPLTRLRGRAASDRTQRGQTR
jgi:hypothetical protein